MSRKIDIKTTQLVRYWFLTVDVDVKLKHKISVEDASQEVDKILSNPKGWVKFGYVFQRVPNDSGLKWRNDENNQQFVLHLRISSPKTVEKECNFDGLSCAKINQGCILFNSQRWVSGSVESGLLLEQYKIYLVQHEIGHLLGRGHEACSSHKEDPCPVMYQQTISKGCCKPNVWPL